MAAACEPSRSTAADSMDEPARSMSGAKNQPVLRTLREDFQEIAARDHSFGGFWVDENGQLVVATKTGEVSRETEELVHGWLRRNSRADLLPRRIEAFKVMYDYAELMGYYEKIRSSVASHRDVAGIGIDERTNSVLVNVRTEVGKSWVESQLAAQKIGAREAKVALETNGYDVQAGLQSTFATLRGGIQVTNSIVGDCSIGFLGHMTIGPNDPYPDMSRPVVTTAAHCTQSQISLVGETFGQPSSARPIGNVSRIAQVYTSCGGGYVWCRYADVALIAVRDTIPIGWATAAISTATTPPANPSYLGWRAYAGSGVTGAVLGETITRVGRTRGQTTGTVVVSCQDRQSTLLPGMWTLCAMNATATTEGGDSGGTVYIPSTVGQPTTPRAVGTLFQGGVGSTWFSSAGFVNLALGNDVYFVW